MTSHTEQPNDVRPSWPTGEAVKAFLRRHPAFLADDVDLLARMLAAGAGASGDNVLDMQNFVIQRLQRDVERLKAANTDLATAREAALVAQGRAHEAVLALLGARTFEHFVAIATSEVPGLLAIDHLTFCVEGVEEPLPPASFHGVRVLPQGAIDSLVGPCRDRLVDSDMFADPRIFGDEAAIIRSQALLRIHLGEGGPAGLLALGCRFPDAFEGEEAEELLCFLTRIVEQCIRVWLEQSC